MYMIQYWRDKYHDLYDLYNLEETEEATIDEIIEEYKRTVKEEEEQK